jgi:hypothetical protein
MKKFLSFVFVFCAFAASVRAQTAEVTIQLDERFFDALLDSLFQNGAAPEFPIAEFRNGETAEKNVFVKAGFETGKRKTETGDRTPACSETIRLLRELGGVKTAVHLREGKIFAPIAFSGKYNPPLIGCVEFSGIADTNIVLDFDQQKQALVGRAQVTNVNMTGTGGIGGSVLARLVQSSIDRRINPIEIIRLDKISFTVPVQNAGDLRMKAVGIRPEIVNGVLNVRVAYQFIK